ncbi:T9SS type A sorting domain-containing protein [Chryseobacterium hagamense]|uniref:Secretion system C-terminal sorting domain-containing protein n=1 Tax=Chryseobacterium hagamense TaxID=395935 RepID=A0A511YJ61_9FLAO|nr:T9SS type A sorting domain-containing protein [Chryseobacterium hagamense]GEN75203.1 hypothetical protein CHA01nite_09430 [Chryseobacterium hagamense]
MKKKFYLLTLFALCAQAAFAQNITIPDPNFKAKILSSGPANTIAKNLSGSYFAVDANGDGEIQQAEAAQVKSLDVNTSSISSLDGITDFTNLESFDCSHNSIDKLFMNMASIKWINASDNTLNNGGVGVGANIEYLDLHNVTFSQMPLNLSNKNMLSYLNLQNSNIYELDCSNSKLTTLLLNGCSNLHILDCSNNLLTSLDLSGLNITGEAYFLGSGPNTLTYHKGGVDCSHNNLTSLNIANLTTNFLNCSYNNLTSLNAGTLTLVKMPNVPVFAIPEPSLYFDCSHNQLTSLNINGSFVIQSFDCSYNNLNTLTIPNIVTQIFSCNNNNLTSLTISDSSEINILNASYNAMTSFISPALLQVSNPNAILNPFNTDHLLDCSHNQLTFLNLNNTQVPSVNASDNNIHTLFIKNGVYNDFIDLQNNSDIQYVCADNDPANPSDPNYTEVNYFQDMLPSAMVGSNCSSFLSVKEKAVAEKVTVYPNPAKDQVQIDADSAIISVVVYDMQGKLVKKYSGTGSASEKIMLDDVPAGNYVLMIITKKDRFTRKIIKR